MRKLLFIFVLLAGVSPGGALTLSEIRTQVRLHIKDTSTTRQRFTDAQLNSLINEAQRDVINATWAIRKYTTQELASGTTYYALPDDTMDIVRVTRINIPLEEKTKSGLDAEVRGWELAGGTPQDYFQDETQPGYIGLHPFPNSSTSTGTLKIEYIASPSALSSDSDIPFNEIDRMTQYHDLLVLFPCYKVFLIEGEQIKFQTYFQNYESRLILMRETYGTKPNFTPGMSGASGGR